MKNDNFQNPCLTKFAVGASFLLVAFTCQVAPSGAQDDEAAAPSAAHTRQSTLLTPTTSRTTTTTVNTHQHAGAKILDDDTDVSDDTQKQTTATTGSAVKGVPNIEYKESAATDAICQKAATFNSQKQYGQASTLLASAITKDPRTISARRLYAMTEILDQEPDKAIAVMEVLGRYTRATPYDKCLLASAFWAKGNAIEAASNFKDAVTMSPDNFYAEQGYIRSLILGKDYVTALQQCTAALRKFTNPGAQVELKKLYQQIQTERAAASGSDSGTQSSTPSRLGAPIPLQELTPYIINRQYGG